MDIRLVGSSAFAILAVTNITININSVRAPENLHYFTANAVEISGIDTSQEVLDRNFQALLAHRQVNSPVAPEIKSAASKLETNDPIQPAITSAQASAAPREVSISTNTELAISDSRGLRSRPVQNQIVADRSADLKPQQTLDNLKQAHWELAASHQTWQGQTTDRPADILTVLPFSINAAGETTITGFLTPQGFKRPQWQNVGDDPVITPESVNKEKFIVMLDPGHGGSDPGSVALNGLQEKDLTLDIAKRIKLFLSEFDHMEVLLTRNHDHGLTRQSRVNRIKHSEADMVISLHFNHLPQPDLNIVESYYAGPRNVAKSRATLAQRALAGTGNIRHMSSRGGVDISFTQGSKRLAKTLHQRIFAEVSFENETVQNAGVKEKTLYVLTQSYKPGALIEMTCLSNPREAARLGTEDYKNRLAASLADGIRNYYESLRISPLNSATDIGV